MDSCPVAAVLLYNNREPDILSYSTMKMRLYTFCKNKIMVNGHCNDKF